MREVRLNTQNPRDLTVQELETLASDLQPEAKSVKVVVDYEEQRGAGVTWWDVLHFVVPEVDFLRDAVYAYMIEKCLDFMRSRRQRKHGAKRPIRIIVLLPDGSKIDEFTDEVEDHTRDHD